MIDPNEAPDGFVAVSAENKGCTGCSFHRSEECHTMKCCASQRSDGQYVMFIPREQSNLSELSNIGDLAEARAEIERLQKFATVNGVSELESELKRWQDIAAKYSQEREHNANESLRWKAECRDRDELIAKLKAQLTAALEAIARMR